MKAVLVHFHFDEHVAWVELPSRCTALAFDHRHYILCGYQNFTELVVELVVLDSLFKSQLRTVLVSGESVDDVPLQFWSITHA